MSIVQLLGTSRYYEKIIFTLEKNVNHKVEFEPKILHLFALKDKFLVIKK
jgi:hypothetical protein